MVTIWLILKTTWVGDDFILTSENRNLFAVGDIGGQVFDESGALEEGTISLFRITEKGGYDTLKLNEPFIGGDYLVEDLLLDDYVLYVQSDTSKYIPTYFADSSEVTFANAPITYSDADTIKLRRDTAGFFVKMRVKPIPEKVADGGEISGRVDLETSDSVQASSRTLARRRVRLAGVSLYRPTSDLRTLGFFDEWSLFAYTQTDENGQFEFTELPKTTYRILIEYPGIPMDTSTTIEFEIGGTNGDREENKIVLEAVVTEGGIKVEEVSNVWVYKEYFDDFRIFPIPTRNSLSLLYSKLKKDQVLAEMSDLQGRKIIGQQLERGVNMKYDLDVSQIPSGIYILTLTDLDKALNIGAYRVVIQR